MPIAGDLKSNDKKDIKQRVRAIQALLVWKETKSVEIRQTYQEKIRKITAERDSFEKKCQELEKQSKLGLSLGMDNGKPRMIGRSSISDTRGSSAGKTIAESHLKKSQADLRRAEAEIQKLNDQLDKAYLNLNKTKVVDRPKGRKNMGSSNFLGSSRLSITKTSQANLSPNGSGHNKDQEPEEGVNFSFGGKESLSQEGPVVVDRTQELQAQNQQLKTMVAQLTASINSKIHDKVKTDVLQEALPDEILNEVESTGDIDLNESVEKL